MEKKDGNLVVTDMDSTNGTYVNERKLVPGFPVAVQPGSLLIFGTILYLPLRSLLTIDQNAGSTLTQCGYTPCLLNPLG